MSKQAFKFTEIAFGGVLPINHQTKEINERFVRGVEKLLEEEGSFYLKIKDVNGKAIYFLHFRKSKKGKPVVSLTMGLPVNR